MSPELETLDQLLTDDLPLTVIQGLYPDANAFLRGISGLLSNGDVRLLTKDKVEVSAWQWQQLLRIGPSRVNFWI